MHVDYTDAGNGTLRNAIGVAPDACKGLLFRRSPAVLTRANSLTTSLTRPKSGDEMSVAERGDIAGGIEHARR